MLESWVFKYSNGQMIYFLLRPLLSVGTLALTGVGWKVQGLEVKLRRISLVGDPDEAV